MLNFSIFLTLSKNMASGKKKLAISGEFNFLSTADSQFPSTGKKQSKSLTKPYFLTGKRVQTGLRERFSSHPHRLLYQWGEAAGEKDW